MSVFNPDGTSSLGQHTKKFIVGALLVIVFSAIAVASAILLEVEDTLNEIRPTDPVAKAQAVALDNVLEDVELGAPQTILLLGSDRRFADIEAKLRPRSDTILLVRLDPDKHATAIMSLPRDLKVEVPGFGTRRINEAYHLGGAKLTIRTIEETLSIQVDHVVNVGFGGFRRAVNRLGCVFADVDRRYFNDNSGPEPNYAVIDIKPGYQKLCGADALDFVRYRHADSDFVRAARQQEFLRQAKQQIGIGKLLTDRKELLRIFGAYTDTDISQSSTAEIFGLLKLAYESSKSPVTEVRFPGKDAPDGSIEISDGALLETVDRFIDVRGKDPAEKPKAPKRIKQRAGLAAGLVFAQRQGEDHVLSTDLRLAPLGLPVMYPRARLAKGGYVQTSSPRSYDIYDNQRKRHRAYRIVLYAGEVGEYYGVQGTTWKTPPILEGHEDQVRMRDRTYRRYFDGRRIRLIAWTSPKAVYWVSNTLSQRLTNRQMMDIARSLQGIG